MPERELAHVAPVIRLRPIRTLVVARDLAFRQRAVTVLRDLGDVGFAIAALDAPADIVALVARHGADVVVLDVTGCEPAAARLVFALSEVVPRVGVVLVSDHPEARHAWRACPKWGWATELSHAVQDAYHRGNPLEEEPIDVNQQCC